jgi:hypothetical protein
VFTFRTFFKTAFIGDVKQWWNRRHGRRHRYRRRSIDEKKEERCKRQMLAMANKRSTGCEEEG